MGDEVGDQDDPLINGQIGPWPSTLADMVDKLTYKPGWTVVLEHPLDRGQGCSGLTLLIYVRDHNSYEPHEPISVVHYFPVPPAAYNEASWCRWLFECFHQVELHECMEWFTIGDRKPFAPNHGPGWDPYLVTMLTTDIDRRTSFRGVVAPAIGHYADHHDGLAALKPGGGTAT